MNQLLAQLAPAQVASFFLVLGRIAPLFLLAPLFSSKNLSTRVKGVAAVGLTIGIAPLAAGKGKVPLDIGGLGGLMIKEILVGLAFAFAVGALFHAVATAGSFLDTLIGFSFGATIDPLTGVQSSVLQQLYGLVAVMVFITVGGDAWLVEGLARTYDLVPLTATPVFENMATGVLKAFTTIFASALAVSAPVVLALVVTDAAFGVVSRVVPQINVFAVGFPAKVAVGGLIIAASLPFAAGWIADELQQSVSSAMSLLKAG